MNIVNLTKCPVIVKTSRGPFLAEPAERPDWPAADTLYVVDDVDDVFSIDWEPVVIQVAADGTSVRKRRLTWAF